MSNFPATQLWNGGNNSLINIVILPDGFQSSELPTFLAQAQKIANYFLAEPPVNKYTSFFNIWTISVPSNQSGASHAHVANDCPALTVQPIATVDNYFGSSFDNFVDGARAHRALIPTNTTLVSQVISASLPQLSVSKLTLPLMVVNTPYYGGLDSGNFVCTGLTSDSLEIALHETIGHGFAGLGDEYQWTAQAWNSMSKFTTTSFLEWKNIYAASVTPTLYPMANNGVSAYATCRMRALGNPFCPVCQDFISSAFTKLINPIISAFPVSPTTLTGGGSQTFTINCIKPNPDTLEVMWLVDGQPVGNGYSYTMINDVQSIGTHTLAAIVQDGSVKLQPATQYKQNWSVTTVVHSSTIDLTVYPKFTIPATQIIPPNINPTSNPDNYRILTNWTAIALPPNYTTVYYEIQLSTDGINFNSVNTVTTSTTSTTHLVGNTNYWMRMRVDYWNGAAMTYGNWSPAQTFKTLPTS